MRKPVRYSFLLAIFLIGLLLPRFAGIFTAQAQVADKRGFGLLIFQGGNTPTATPTPTGTIVPSPGLTGVPSAETGSQFGSVQAFIQPPEGHVSTPYVILTGYSPAGLPTSVKVRGFENSREFVCSQLPCTLTLEGSSRIVFHAFNDFGTVSDDVIASVSVIQEPEGYLVKIDSINQFAQFFDACSIIWNVRDEKGLAWNDFVQYPYQLNTQKTLHALATQLLLNGIVDASDCPSGGLSLSLNFPTACGLEKSREEMIRWQNQFDDQIWYASGRYGIPPKLLKTVIEVESQFWPGNTRGYLEEYGLGQINQLGVDVLLRRDPSLYLQVCSGVIANCSIPYELLDEEDQALIRGTLVKSVDASCAECEYGINLEVARNSILTIANLLKANCQQVKDVLGKDIVKVKYEDLWRFLLANYHNGVNCFYEAILDARVDGQDLTWDTIGKRLRCGRGPAYVDDLMENLEVFDYYVYQPEELSGSIVSAVIVPTNTPAPTPTAYISDSIITVQVFMDRNGNDQPDDGEWIDSMSVRLTTSDGDVFETRTLNGIAIFDMNGYRPGQNVTVSLPGLYRSESFILPQHGNITITFKFDQPALPTVLP